MSYLIFTANFWFFAGAVFVLVSLAIELPYRLLRFTPRITNMDAFNGVVAGLLTLSSFVLGLSFSQAQGRFDSRRGLVIQEANAIGTTWLRANQLGHSQEVAFRQALIDYTKTRLQGYSFRRVAISERNALLASFLRRSDEDQNKMWALSSSALSNQPANLGLSLLMQSLNETIDVSAAQLQALRSHIPTPVILVMILLVTLGALSLGIRFAADKSRPIFLSVIYVVANVLVICLVVDYDRPQTGLVTINLDPIKNQLQSMEASPP
jgi:hypothetical protein